MGVSLPSHNRVQVFDPSRTQAAWARLALGVRQETLRGGFRALAPWQGFVRRRTHCFVAQLAPASEAPLGAVIAPETKSVDMSVDAADTSVRATAAAPLVVAYT